MNKKALFCTLGFLSVFVLSAVLVYLGYGVVIASIILLTTVLICLYGVYMTFEDFFEE